MSGNKTSIKRLDIHTTKEDSKEITEPPSVTAEAYYKLYTSLYAYRAGTLGFLDWLDLAEKLLGVRPDRDDQPDT